MFHEILKQREWKRDHSASNLRSKLRAIIEEWYISDKCVVITNHYASNIVSATKELPFETFTC